MIYGKDLKRVILIIEEGNKQMSLWKEQPYMLKRKQLIFKTVHQIFFEDTYINIWSFSLETIQETVRLLNVAWNLGYSSGKLIRNNYD